MVDWYYASGDEQAGPVDEAEVRRLITAGSITPTTLVWRKGLGDWVEAQTQLEMTIPRSAATPTGGPSTRPVPPPPPPPAPPPTSTAQPVPPQPAPAPEPWRQPSNPAPVSDAYATSAQPSADMASQLGPDGLYVEAPSRGFGEAISVCFSKFVTFSGRASRSEYWFWILFTFLVGIVTGLIDFVAFPDLVAVSPLNSLATLALLLPSLAVSWRRLHDTNRSGWWLGGFYLGLLGFILVIGAIFATTVEGPNSPFLQILPLFGLVFVGYLIMLFVYFVQKGTLGPNRFG